MSARYYISEILPPDPQPLDPEAPWKDYYRPAVSDAQPRVSSVNMIPTSKTDGRPMFLWALVFAKGEDWSGVEADPRNFRLFAGEEGDPFDLKSMMDALALKRLSDVAAPKKAAIRNFLNSKGLTLTGSESFREILRAVRRRLNPNDIDGELREWVG